MGFGVSGGNLAGLIFALGVSLSLNLLNLVLPSHTALPVDTPASAAIPAQTAALRRLSNSVARLEQTVEDQCGCEGGSPRSEGRLVWTVRLFI